MKNFSLFLPTRGRPHSLRRLLESIRETTTCPEQIEIILCIDADDLSMKDFPFEGLPMLRANSVFGMSMGTMFHLCIALSSGRWLMLINDDMVFCTKGWDVEFAHELQRFPDEIALTYGNDLDRGENIPTFPIITRRVWELTESQICPTGYLNLYIDCHILDIFQRLTSLGHNRVIYRQDLIFEHQHHELGKSTIDATAKKKNPERDNQLFLFLANDRQVQAKRLAYAIEQACGKKQIRESAPAVSLMAQSEKMARGLSPSIKILLGKDLPFDVELSVPPGGQSDVVPWELEGGRPVQIFRPHESLSFEAFVSLVARKSKAEFLVVLRSGWSSTPEWLEVVVERARTDERIGVVGCRILDSRTGRLRHAGVGFMNRPGTFGISFVGRGLPADHPVAMRERDVQAVSTAGFLVRRKAFLEVGGFSTHLPAGLEGVELCLKLRERGYRIVYTPGAVLHYQENPEWHEELYKIRDARVLGDGWQAKIEDDLEAQLREVGLNLPPGLANL